MAAIGPGVLPSGNQLRRLLEEGSFRQVGQLLMNDSFPAERRVELLREIYRQAQAPHIAPNLRALVESARDTTGDLRGIFATPGARIASTCSQLLIALACLTSLVVAGVYVYLGLVDTFPAWGQTFLVATGSVAVVSAIASVTKWLSIKGMAGYVAAQADDRIRAVTQQLVHQDNLTSIVNVTQRVGEGIQLAAANLVQEILNARLEQRVVAGVQTIQRAVHDAATSITEAQIPERVAGVVDETHAAAMALTQTPGGAMELVVRDFSTAVISGFVSVLRGVNGAATQAVRELREATVPPDVPVPEVPLEAIINVL